MPAFCFLGDFTGENLGMKMTTKFYLLNMKYPIYIFIMSDDSLKAHLLRHQKLLVRKELLLSVINVSFINAKRADFQQVHE